MQQAGTEFGPARIRLFREEAVAAHARRLEGEILIVQPPSVNLLLTMLGAFALVAIAFLCTATYARTERVTGYLVPRGGVSTILPVRPGVVSDVLVRAGDRVRAGDILVRVASRSSLPDGTELVEGLERSLRRQREILEQKRLLAESTAEVGEQKRREDLAELQQRLAHFRGLEVLARKRLALARRRETALSALLDKGIVSEQDHQEQIDRVLSLEAELRHAQDARLAQEKAKRELESELELEPTERASRQTDLELQILAVDAQLRELEARQAYSLLAPIDGRVASLQAAPGVVVNPEVPVAMIIPDTGELEAHLLVPTRAAGQIEVDQRVEISYAAFPAHMFGVRAARIQRIDTAVLAPREVQAPVTVEEPVYRVVAKLDQQTLEAFGRTYPLQPGMSLDAEIALETRSFMTWILEPLYSLSRADAGASAS